MSFFLGKDNADKGIVHITNGTNNVLEMKSGIRDNTVFHSTLPLSSYKLIPLTLGTYYPYTQFVTYGGWIDFTLVQTCFIKYKDQSTAYDYIPISGARTYSMSGSNYSSLISQLQTKPNRVLFLDSNYNLVNNCGIGNIMSLHSYTSNGWNFSTYFSTSYTFAIANVYLQPTITTISYILLIYDDYYPALTGAIKIDNTGLFINSTNLFLDKNVISNTLNIGATKILDNFYLVTTPSSSYPGYFKINATSGNTTITAGDATLFSSLYNSYMPFKINTISSISTSILYGDSYTNTLLYTMNGNENFVIVGYKLVGVEANTTVYAFIGRGSSSVVLLDFGFDAETLSVLLTYVYMSGSNVYIRSRKGVAGGSGVSVTKSRIYTIESF